MKNKYSNLAAMIIDALAENKKEFFQISFNYLINYDKEELFREGITLNEEKKEISLCCVSGMIHTYKYNEVVPVFKTE